MKRVLALVDANNFYVSCERLFNASLRERPVIVVGNGDGCVVARSNEAKALGVKMGMPLFQCKKLVERYNIAVYSSNYALYQDMSDRLRHCLATFSERNEYYSIDEAYLDLSHVPPANLSAYGQQIRAQLLQHTGIPTSVGIAPTKVLSKIACEVAKKHPEHQGVFDLVHLPERETQYPPRDGRRRGGLGHWKAPGNALTTQRYLHRESAQRGRFCLAATLFICFC